MERARENGRFGVLYVDDEEKSLKYFRYLFQKKARIFTALNATEGYQALKENIGNIGIVMADQRMPGEKGVQLLQKARNLNPRILRILITAFSDFDAATAAINEGAIYRYITKPWDFGKLDALLVQGLEIFTRNEELHLLKKISVLQEIMTVEKLKDMGTFATYFGTQIKISMAEIKSFIDKVPAKIEQEGIDIDSYTIPDFSKKMYPKIQGQAGKILCLLSKLEEAFIKNEEYVFSTAVCLYDIVSLAIEKMKPRCEQNGITVLNHIPNSLPSLKVDEEKFPRLFELLLEDEIVSLGKGGEVKISAKLLEKTRGKPLHIQIKIEDNEPVPRQESIFDPFFIRQRSSGLVFLNRSTDLKEAGLNLITCFFIIYNHRGKIKVDSKKGNAFIITLPTDPKY